MHQSLKAVEYRTKWKGHFFNEPEVKIKICLKCMSFGYAVPIQDQNNGDTIQNTRCAKFWLESRFFILLIFQFNVTVHARRLSRQQITSKLGSVDTTCIVLRRLSSHPSFSL